MLKKTNCGAHFYLDNLWPSIGKHIDAYVDRFLGRRIKEIFSEV